MPARLFGTIRVGLCAAMVTTMAGQAPAGQAPAAPPPTPAASPQPPAAGAGAAGSRPAAAGPAAAGPGAPGTAKTLAAAIDKLGTLDFAVRTAAAAAVRRAPPAQAVPALMAAATSHADGYVRFRALVLLAGFGDPRTRDVMIRLIDDPNDRLRDVAYA